MEKLKRLSGIALMLAALVGLASCEENEYYLSPEVGIQVPDGGLSVALGETLEIKADVKNGGENPRYQWFVNDIKVSTAPTLMFTGTEPGNNTVKLSVTNCDGTSSDAATVFVARSPLEVSISVVGDRSTTVQYQDSIVLRGLVYSREDYEVEWIREGERVSKEFYYVFKGEKEGTHRLTFKALDKNGKYSTEDIDITVEVPLLAVEIKEPKHGFRCPQGQKIMLHGEANRVNNIKYEWLVGGQVVCTEPDYEFEGTTLDNVEVALRVIDPTQTATVSKTIEVHHPYLYGTVLVGKYDFYFVDYLGNVTEKIFSAANPQFEENEIDFSRGVGYNNKNIVVVKKNTSLRDPETKKRVSQIEFLVIDSKLFTAQKTLTVTFDQRVNINDIFVCDDRFFVRANDMTSSNPTPETVHEINISTGEMKLVGQPTAKKEAMLMYNDVLYSFTGTHAIAVNSLTGETIYDVDGQAGYVTGMKDISTWTIINDHLFHTTTDSSYEDYFELATGIRNQILIDADNPRLELANLATDGKTVYSCNDGFLSIIDIDTKEQKYVADLMKDNSLQYFSLPANARNLFISPTGQILVRFRKIYPQVDKVIVLEDNYEKPVATIETALSQYINAFIPKN